MTFNSFRKKADKSYMRIGLGLSILFLIGCMPPPGGYGPGGYGNNYYGGASTGAPGNPPPQPRTNEEYENRKANDPGRAAVLDRAKRNGREDICEDEDKDHECWDQCKEIYHRSSDREECRELPTDQIEKLLDVHKTLNRPSADKLEDLDIEDLEVYFELSIEAFERLIREYRKSDVEDILYWMIDDPEIADFIAGEDDDYRTIDALLSKFGSHSSNNLEGLFKDKNISSRDHTLLEMAVYADNEPALDYFFDYFLNKDPSCSSETKRVSLSCFTKICKIGKGFENDNHRPEILEYSVFSNYLDKIIETGRNGIVSDNLESNKNKWCQKKTRPRTSGTCKPLVIDDVDDLGTDWTANGENKGLCGGLG